MSSIKDAVAARQGIYTIPEAALYSRLPPVTLRRWIQGDSKGAEVIIGHEDIENGQFVSFLDLIQALAIRAIRTERGISLQRIRDALHAVQDKYGLQWPLAKRHTTYLFGREVFIQLEDMDDPIQVSGRQVGQIAMRKIIEIFLEDVSWDSEGLAATYRPHAQGIIHDPNRMFGEPIVESCGISALPLWHAVHTEGDFESAAKAYDVSVDEVKTAFRYFDLLEGRQAA